jgi:hypothetical protein
MITEITEAVVTALNTYASGIDPVPFVAIRKYVPQFELADLKTLRVVVVPISNESTPATRGKMENDVTVSIGVMKKLEGETESDIDPLVLLAENIATFLDKQDLVSGDMKIMWLSSEHKPIYSAQEIQNKKVFTSVIAVTYRVYA